MPMPSWALHTQLDELKLTFLSSRANLPLLGHKVRPTRIFSFLLEEGAAPSWRRGWPPAREGAPLALNKRNVVRSWCLVGSKVSQHAIVETLC